MGKGVFKTGQGFCRVIKFRDNKIYMGRSLEGLKSTSVGIIKSEERIVSDYAESLLGSVGGFNGEVGRQLSGVWNGVGSLADFLNMAEEFINDHPEVAEEIASRLNALQEAQNLDKMDQRISAVKSKSIAFCAYLMEFEDEVLDLV